MNLKSLFSNSIQKVESILSNQSESEIIEQIHNEFDTAPDRLIEEANKILSKGIDVDLYMKDKGERLRKLGFNNTIESKELSKIEAKEKSLNMTKELAETIKYYQQKYPFSKFLTVDELDRICLKYGLVHAPVGAYIKNVPDKNLLEIENAQPLIVYDFPVLSKPTPIGKSEEDFAKEFFEYFGQTQIFKNKRYKVGFYIAAPSNHFDLSKLEKNGKYGYRTPIIKNDPIVFRYCRGGILVDSKWGLCASDPILLNPINN